MKSTKKITSIVLALMMLVISVAGLVTVNASTGGTLSRLLHSQQRFSRQQFSQQQLSLSLQLQALRLL